MRSLSQGKLILTPVNCLSWAQFKNSVVIFHEIEEALYCQNSDWKKERHSKWVVWGNFNKGLFIKLWAEFKETTKGQCSVSRPAHFSREQIPYGALGRRDRSWSQSAEKIAAQGKLPNRSPQKVRPVLGDLRGRKPEEYRPQLYFPLSLWSFAKTY